MGGLSAEDVCEGYFATKKAKADSGETGAEAIDTAGRQGDLEAERAAYDLIMKGKEDLLTFPSELDDAETLRRRRVAFIFSHSALREGWDNPNVFQICTLSESVSTIRKRQEIGRGVRIPVDQHGNRIDDEALNVLTVIPNQSYKAFVADYQNEGEQLGLGAGDPPREGGRSKRQKVKVQATGAVRERFEDLWSRIARKSSWSIESLDLETLARKIEARRAEVSRQTTAPFRIPTPVGGYVPDLGIVKDDARDGARLYLVREVKGTTGTGTDDASLEAERKIRCAQRHFPAIQADVDYSVATDPRQV